MPLQALGAKWGLEAGSWMETLYDCLMGMAVGMAHFEVLYQEQVLDRWHRWTKKATTQQSIEDGDDNKKGISQESEVDGEEGALKVVVVGYGRTGTYSVAMALEELGYPTLHTQHWYQHPEFLQSWVDAIFEPSLQQGEIVRRGHPDFADIVRLGYTATTDLPLALYYQEILHQYPQCKFILTTRRNETQWLHSWQTMVNGITPAAYWGSWLARAPSHMFRYMRWMYAIVNANNTQFLTQKSYPLPPQDWTAVLESYHRHNAGVRQHIPTAQLLELQLGGGAGTSGNQTLWPKLCDFLEIDRTQCPTDTPFPRTNSAQSLRAQTTMTYSLIWVAIVLSAALLAAALAYALALFWRTVSRPRESRKKTTKLC